MEATTIAKWFINELQPEPLKLQKLLYLAQGFSFAFYDKELFKDEIEAWVHGPVIPEVYFKYNGYKYNPINTIYKLPEFSEETLDVLNYVKDNYSKYDSKFLEKLTHNQEPWIESRSGLQLDEKSDKTISKILIANYFINLIHQPDEEEWD